MADLDKAERMLTRFKEMVDGFTGGDIPRSVADHLVQLKLLVMGFPSLPPTLADSPNEKQEGLIARGVFEYASLLSVKADDMRSFERHIAQVKAYYLDFRALLAESPHRHLLLGLNLLHLLVENRLGDFHAEMELLGEDDFKNPLVQFPVRLEEWLMEGSYNKILSTSSETPSPLYAPFLTRLVDTVRDEIADCSASSYDTLGVEAAQRMMLFKTPEELRSYIEEKQPAWHIEAGVIHFNPAQKARLEIPSLTLIASTLEYATELERIV